MPIYNRMLHPLLFDLSSNTHMKDMVLLFKPHGRIDTMVRQSDPIYIREMVSIVLNRSLVEVIIIIFSCLQCDNKFGVN